MRKLKNKWANAIELKQAPISEQRWWMYWRAGEEVLGLAGPQDEGLLQGQPGAVARG